MSDTPETDEAVKASNGQWSFVLKEACQRLERERNKAVEDATNYYAKIGELERERDEARARVELIKPHKNNPVAEFFSSSNTPETDAKASPHIGFYSCATVPAEFARKLERERDEAMEALSGRTVSCAACNHAAIERDEAREKAERYRLEANAMMLQRDELKKIVEQRILVGAEIHDKANSLLKQSNRTEAECEALRKQLTAATSALRQIHLEVGDWIRSTIIVEE